MHLTIIVRSIIIAFLVSAYHSMPEDHSLYYDIAKGNGGRCVMSIKF